MSTHPNPVSSGEIPTADQAPYQELDASQPAPQESQQIAQELPDTQPDTKEHPAVQQQPPPFNNNAIKSESDSYPTALQQQPPTTSNHAIKSESDIYPTVLQQQPPIFNSNAIKSESDYPNVVNMASDEYPTPVSSPAPTLPGSAPRYSMSYGHEGYYPPDKVAYTSYDGNNAGAGMGGYVQQHPFYPQLQPLMMNSQPAYYEQQQQLPSQTAPYDASNPVVAHGGVVPIQEQSRKKYVNLCGTMFAQKTVIILGSLAALIVIIVIGVGAGLGAQGSQNRQYRYSY